LRVSSVAIALAEQVLGVAASMGPGGKLVRRKLAVPVGVEGTEVVLATHALHRAAHTTAAHAISALRPRAHTWAETPGRCVGAWSAAVPARAKLLFVQNGVAVTIALAKHGGRIGLGVWTSLEFVLGNASVPIVVERAELEGSQQLLATNPPAQ
jgi:hypothetical protein